jgi:hypothetical protein
VRAWLLGGRPVRQHNQSRRRSRKAALASAGRRSPAGAPTARRTPVVPLFWSAAKKPLPLLLALLALLACACARPPQPPCNQSDLSGCVIDEVDVVDNPSVDSDEIEERIATTESQHVFGGALEGVPILSVWDSLTVDYEHFDRFVLERDLARVERFYRSKGFYQAHARAGRVVRLANGRVRVEIAVTEGQRVTIGRVDLAWKDWRLPLAAEVTKPVTDAKNRLRVGRPFDEERYEEIKRAVLRAMTDHGFAYAGVHGKASVDLTRGVADILFTVELGPKCTFGQVSFRGLEEIPSAPLRDALGFQPGDAFSTSALESAEYALADFGVFGSIEVKPLVSEPGTPRQTVVPIVISVQPAALRAIKAGIGAEVGNRAEAHLVTGWENRNLFGGLRRFTIEAKPGLVLYPLRLQTLFDEAPQRLRPLPELKLNSEFRQPLPFDTRTSLILRGAFRLYQYIDPRSIDEYRPRSCLNGVLDEGETGAGGQVGPFEFGAVDRGGPCRPLTASADVSADDVPILGYREYVGSAGLVRRFWNSQVELGLYSNLQFDQPFSYNATTVMRNGAEVVENGLSDSYQSVVVPFQELAVSLDLRRDRFGKQNRVAPSYGIFLSDDVQVGQPRRGKPAGIVDDCQKSGTDCLFYDLRIRPEVRGYVPITRRITLALRLAGGVLLAGYGDNLASAIAETTPPAARTPQEEYLIARDTQILQFRGFFGGGPYSNRGYSQNAVNPHVFICADGAANCETEKVYQLISTGGLAMWEASAEVRLPVAGDFGLTVFADASDVTRDITLRFTRPHFSVGVGARYQTPVGPLRADLGFRVPCMQVIESGCGDLAPRDQDPAAPPGVLDEAPQDTFLGTDLPLQISIAIGETF